MGLRNAFEEMATESTLRRLLEHMRFAKDASDRLRVSVDTMPQSTVYTANTSAGIQGVATSAPFGPNTWNQNDARHEMQEFSLQTFTMTRNRWTIT